MSTDYKYHITAIVTADNIDAANALVSCKNIGESGPGDLDSFKPSNWYLGDEQLAFVCTAITDTVIAGLLAAEEGEYQCELPDWDKEGKLVDVDAAQALIESATVYSGLDEGDDGPVELEWDAEGILIVLSPDWRSVLQAIGAVEHLPEQEEVEEEMED